MQMLLCWELKRQKWQFVTSLPEDNDPFTMPEIGTVFAEFETLDTAEEYEELIRTAVRGVPSHWPPQIAKQCLYSPTSSNGKRQTTPFPHCHLVFPRSHYRMAYDACSKRSFPCCKMDSKDWTVCVCQCVAAQLCSLQGALFPDTWPRDYPPGGRRTCSHVSSSLLL